MAVTSHLQPVETPDKIFLSDTQGVFSAALFTLGRGLRLGRKDPNGGPEQSGSALPVDFAPEMLQHPLTFVAVSQPQSHRIYKYFETSPSTAVSASREF